VYINWLSERESHKPINHHNCVMSILHCRHWVVMDSSYIPKLILLGFNYIPNKIHW
jgi:hypothetical protein